jgi:hypothetical protein
MRTMSAPKSLRAIKFVCSCGQWKEREREKSPFFDLNRSDIFKAYSNASMKKFS